jgi:hypothetical protein
LITSGSSSETEEYMSINSSPNKSPPKRSEFRKLLQWLSVWAQSKGGMLFVDAVILFIIGSGNNEGKLLDIGKLAEMRYKCDVKSVVK